MHMVVDVYLYIHETSLRRYFLAHQGLDIGTIPGRSGLAVLFTLGTIIAISDNRDRAKIVEDIFRDDFSKFLIKILLGIHLISLIHGSGDLRNHLLDFHHSFEPIAMRDSRQYELSGFYKGFFIVERYPISFLFVYLSEAYIKMMFVRIEMELVQIRIASCEILVMDKRLFPLHLPSWTIDIIERERQIHFGIAQDRVGYIFAGKGMINPIYKRQITEFIRRCIESSDNLGDYLYYEFFIEEVVDTGCNIKTPGWFVCTSRIEEIYEFRQTLVTHCGIK